MLDDLFAKFAQVSGLAYLIVFLGAFLETIPAAGILIPGQTVVLIAGFLAQEGILSLRLVFILAAFGAIAGDAFGYWLGRKYGIQYFFKQKGLIQQTASLLRTNPYKTLIGGRFNSVTRAFAPFAAGASGVRVRTFLTANIIGGLVWAAVWVGAGFIFGASYALASKQIERIILFAAVVAILAYFGHYYLRKRKLVTRRATALLLWCITGLAGAVLLSHQVINDGPAVRLDNIINDSIYSLRVPLGIFFARCISFLGQPSSILVVTAILLLLLWRRHKYRSMALVVISMAGAAVLDLVIKAAVNRARPDDAILQVFSPSFASGHVIIATVFCGAMYLTYRRFIRRKILFTSFCVAIPVVMAASRLYLGVHWFTDVAAGACFGIAWLAFVFLTDEAYRAYKNKQQERLFRN